MGMGRFAKPLPGESPQAFDPPTLRCKRSVSNTKIYTWRGARVRTIGPLSKSVRPQGHVGPNPTLSAPTRSWSPTEGSSQRTSRAVPVVGSPRA